MADAFNDGDPLLVSRGGMTYRELLGTKRGGDFAVEVAECMRNEETRLHNSSHLTRR